MNIKGTLIGIGIGLSIGNFLYQGFTGQHWDVALERTWFQLTALAAVYLSYLLH